MIKALSAIRPSCTIYPRIYPIKCSITPGQFGSIRPISYQYFPFNHLIQVSHKRYLSYFWVNLLYPTKEISKIQPRPKPWKFYKSTVKQLHYGGIIFDLMWRHASFSAACIAFGWLYIHYIRTENRMSNVVIHKKEPIILICKRCGNQWPYRGNNPYVATCSYCKTTISLRKHRILQPGFDCTRDQVERTQPQEPPSVIERGANG